MPSNNGKRLTIVWLALSAVTLVSLATAPPAAHAALPNATLTIAVILVSLIKVRFILQEFMEVRHAPALLSRITDLWVIVTAVVLIGGYLAGGSLLRS